MSRVIVAAAAIFAVAALVLHKALLNGPFTEPALLITMGSFFLLAARVSGVSVRREPLHEKETLEVVPERHRASA